MLRKSRSVRVLDLRVFAVFLGLLAVAISMMTRGKGSAVTPSPALDGSRMLVITADIARRYEQGMRGCAADSVAGLYAPNGVSYFKQGVLGRAAILADIGAFCDRVLAVDPFTVRIDSMRSAGDGIDAWWTVVSGRTLRGDTLYRDTSADLLHIAPRDGGWSITAQRHLWSKHYSVGPPAKPRPIVSRPRPRQTVTPARAVEIHLPPPKGRLKKLEGGLERGGKRGGGKGHRRARGG